MEKSSSSSLNFKTFRKFFSKQSKSYKISPGNGNSYHSTEIKLNGLNTSSFDDSLNSHNIDDVYSLKRNKINSSNSNTSAAPDETKSVSPNFCERLISGCNSTFCLTVLTPVACSFSVIIIVAAIAGPLWISTEERIPYYAVNSTFYRSNYTLSYIIKSSNASLWIFCTRQALDDNRAKLDFTQKNCTRISFLSLDPYQQDLTDFTTEPTYVIPYTITLSTPLLIISFIILLTSYLLFLLAICSHKYKIFYFAAGIGFIISGLLSLSGLIMFISIFKSEVYHKLKTEPTSASSREASFTFNYGHSFYLYVIGFVVVEMSGILNVCLYSRLQMSHEGQQQQRRCIESSSNYVKVGKVDADPSKITGACHHHVPKRNFVSDRQSHAHQFTNGFLPHQQSCSVHAAINKASVKSAGDPKDVNKGAIISSHQAITFDEQNFHQNSSLKMRNASTSTLDLVNSSENGDGKSQKNNQRAITKNKSSVSSKLDFNNFFGMMRRGGKDSSSAKNETSPQHHVQRVGRLKAAKNVYFIDEPREDEPNIFIIDADTINKHKRFQCTRKSLEDIHNNETTFEQEPWSFASRSSYGSRTLPRDFCRRNVRASLHNFLDNHHQHHQMNHVERSNMKRHCSHNHLVDDVTRHIPPPNGFAFQHSCSFDELSSSKLNRNHYLQQIPLQTNNHQWPKVIPKSPSSYSVNSLRLNHNHHSHHQQQSDIPSPPPPPHSFGNKNIVEFDLEKIEKEFRKSHSNLLNRDFGTAV